MDEVQEPGWAERNEEMDVESLASPGDEQDGEWVVVRCRKCGKGCAWVWVPGEVAVCKMCQVERGGK